MKGPLSALAPTFLIETAAARVALAAPCARLSLRARGNLAPLEAALGLTLPVKIGRRTGAGGVEALCLGPDEWMLHAPEAMVPGIAASCAAVYPNLPHSLVDVSAREVTLVIEGARALELLTIGMPRDPESIALGEGRRTNFDGVTVILWRDDETRFRMDVWHSFSVHLLHLLETGCRELAAEAV